MTFTERFPNLVCEGDTIACEFQRLKFTARIVHDDCPDPPDQRQNGFWPSLDKNAPGFIGPGPRHRTRYQAALRKTELIMNAWRRGDWFYCGVILSVSFEGVEIDECCASLWGIEANHPGTDNACLTEVANELLAEAAPGATKRMDQIASAWATSTMPPP